MIKSNHTYRLALTYFTFRILLAAVLFVISVLDSHITLAGNYQSVPYLITIGIYFISALATQLYTLAQTRPPSNFSLFVAIIFDVGFCLVCMHLTGGFGTGIAILLLSPVAIAGIFFVGIFAYFIAAISSIGVLLHIAWSSMQSPDQMKYFVPAGLLGMLFFSASLATQLIARHIRRTEILADEQQDLAEKLAQTNLLILQKMQTGIIVIHANGCIHSINNSAQQLLGSTYQVGDAIPEKLQSALIQWQSNPQNAQINFQEKPGLPLLRASFSAIQENSKASDIVIFLENQSLLTQRAQHIKLASLGRLSASIAHEIRNPLSTINHASQLLAESKQIDSADQRLLHMIENQVSRINNIINNVLSISRRTAAKPHKIDIGACIDRVISQLNEALGIQIKANIHLSDSPFLVPFDEGQLQQVLNNLIDNAISYSFKEQGRHSLTIKGTILDGKATLAFYDEGPGIAEEDIDKVFEPFYTTSPQGTGLGLYICRELCELNQAVLDYLYDDQGRGHFTIHFAHIDRRLTVTE